VQLADLLLKADAEGIFPGEGEDLGEEGGAGGMGVGGGAVGRQLAGVLRECCTMLVDKQGFRSGDVAASAAEVIRERAR
jgi:hypothetical protein